MLPYEFYKSLHFVGIFLTLLAYGGLIFQMLLGKNKNFPYRRLLMLGHGLGLFFILFAGFGLIARLNVGWPTWALLKIGVWFLLGIMVIPILRKPESNKWTWAVILLLASTAAILGTWKPF